MIICPICNKEMKCINSMHLKSHNLTMIEFKKQFTNYETHTKDLKLKNKESSNKGIKVNNELRRIKAKENLVKKIEDFNLLGKKCKQCDKALSYKKQKTIFCNSSCAAKYNNIGRLVNYSEEAKEKLRLVGLKQVMNFNEYQKIRPKAQVYNKICEICNKIFQVNNSKKLNKTCSKECRSLLFSKTAHRENNTYGKSGYYQGVYCASSWELAFLIYNKDLDKDIKRCDLTFNYLMKDIEHTYFPDFIIDNIIYEVKGRELEDVKFKTEAVIKAGYKIELIRRKEILPIIKQIKIKYNVKDIIDLYD